MLREAAAGAAPRLPQGAWLEEQQAELRDRSEERRRLAAAWAEFHTRERLSRERAEQDKERALGMDSALRNLAKVPHALPGVPKPLPGDRALQGQHR